MIAQSLFYRFYALLSRMNFDLIQNDRIKYIYLVWVRSGKEILSSLLTGHRRSLLLLFTVLFLITTGCSAVQHGFSLSDGNCDCTRSFFFLSQNHPRGAKLALEGDYAGAQQVFKQQLDAAHFEEACLIENNLGLVAMLQNHPQKALQHLWEAHSRCPNNSTIEENLKNLLSRIPAS